MSNIFEYIKLNKNKSFHDKKINEIDKTILILLSYIDFNNIVPSNEEKITLNNALYLFIKNKDKKTFLKQAIFNNKIYELAESLINTKRYGDIKLSNYIYINNKDQQIGAISFRFNNTLFISFEGTESSMIGWKEDAQMSYSYPIKSGLTAIDYVKETIEPLDLKVIIGGHSKGGHLALISTLNQGFINRLKIKEIINIDGPGLKEEEYNSKEYYNIKEKLIHIIPNYSIVGQLLYSDNNEIVKSKRFDIMSHSPFEWEIENDKFVRTTISNMSNNINKSFNRWLENHPLNEREQVVTNIFNIFDNLKIDNINQLVLPKNIIGLLKETKKLDDYTKDIIKSIIKRSDK